MTEPNNGASEFGLEPLPLVAGRAVVLRAVGLTKTYAAVARAGSGTAAAAAPVLELFRGLDLTVHAGEMVAIVGESGAGKSSLLHLLAAFDGPTAGGRPAGGGRAGGRAAAGWAAARS